jgi:hypothetical protein
MPNNGQNVAMPRLSALSPEAVIRRRGWHVEPTTADGAAAFQDAGIITGSCGFAG